MGPTYFSHYPDCWSAIPDTGVVYFNMGQMSEVDERSITVTQVVMTFVMAAIESPSLAYIQRHPVTQAGLRRFMFRDPHGYFS